MNAFIQSKVFYLYYTWSEGMGWGVMGRIISLRTVNKGIYHILNMVTSYAYVSVGKGKYQKVVVWGSQPHHPKKYQELTHQP